MNPFIRITDNETSEAPRYVRFEDFLKANAHDAEIVHELRAWTLDEPLMLGGGACPRMRLDRIDPLPMDIFEIIWPDGDADAEGDCIEKFERIGGVLIEAGIVPEGGA